jgi:hypothetical protein
MTQSHNNQSYKPDEQLYNHLIHWVKVESPSEVLLRFQTLFVDSANYPDPQIQKALHQVLGNDLAEQNFKSVFNRCCYILLNNWRNQPSLQWAVDDLLTVLNDFSSEAYCSSAHRLHQLLCNFTQSEDYVRLQKSAHAGFRGTRNISHIFEVPEPQPRLDEHSSDLADDVDHSEGSQPLKTIVYRYPFLYEHCLINKCNTNEQIREMKQQRANVQQAFASNLHTYYMHHVKRSSHGCSTPPQGLTSPQNPTNLSDAELHHALTHFTGRVHHNRTYQHAAKDFLRQSESAPNFRVFKDDLYEYLTATVKPYGNRRFHEKLQERLRKSHSQHDAQAQSLVLLPEVCHDLFKFLVMDKERPQESVYTFMDLIGNIGPTLLVGMLLKIALLCKKAREFLDSQVALLFNHHSTCPRRDVNWLEKSLDHLNIALCTHFDRPDFLTI